MNINEAKFIGHEQAKGDNAPKQIPIGSRVALKNYSWPTGFLVIGHTDPWSYIFAPTWALSDCA